MGSGDRVTLDFEGDGLTQVTVEGQLVDGLVRNAGLLQSDGGNVTLVALADTDGDGLSIVHTGVIRARTLENRQGRVVLSAGNDRSEEHTSELQSLMRNSYAGLCMQQKNTHTQFTNRHHL